MPDPVTSKSSRPADALIKRTDRQARERTREGQVTDHSAACKVKLDPRSFPTTSNKYNRMIGRAIPSCRKSVVHPTVDALIVTVAPCNHLVALGPRDFSSPLEPTVRRCCRNGRQVQTVLNPPNTGSNDSTIPVLARGTCSLLYAGLNCRAFVMSVVDQGVWRLNLISDGTGGK
ncbi:hypothetical protein BDW42DRAFT_141201 [Aspergillus taichungensis]|uniref:Uncharacterized protein n=1 Tax=Aspergillus taichungensis TaxID=482145 RepID=A0A2J5HN14_9EURO|nr:hypothetical protein BDW42DRAFT_141201 [Aspergillus taichungensis]